MVAGNRVSRNAEHTRGDAYAPRPRFGCKRIPALEGRLTACYSGRAGAANRRRKQPGRLVERLLPFPFGNRVGHDSGPAWKRSSATFEHRRSNRHGELAFSVVAEVADGAGVDAARMRLEFGDNFEGALFRSAGDRTTRESRRGAPPG